MVAKIYLTINIKENIWSLYHSIREIEREREKKRNQKETKAIRVKLWGSDRWKYPPPLLVVAKCADDKTFVVGDSKHFAFFSMLLGNLHSSLIPDATLTSLSLSLRHTFREKFTATSEASSLCLSFREKLEQLIMAYASIWGMGIHFQNKSVAMHAHWESIN